MMKRLMGAWRSRVSTADGMAGAKNSKVSAYADMHGGGHQAYRADIDGLRTVAVLSVLVFHAFPSLLPGGFVGVDIFFVISGFLISGIIFREVQAGTFTFADFYSRRVRRIFPALMLVLVCSAAAGWFVLLAEEYATLGKHVVAGVVFVSNILLWRESGYFDVTSELKPLLHLWSLGVEEQFYLFWPVIVLCAARWKMRVIRMAIGLAVLSFVCNIVLMQLKPVATFFLLPTRFWELMAGGILAWYLPSTRVRDFLSNSLMRFNGKSISNADIAALLGLSLLLVAIFGLDADVEFPGWYALLPVVGAVCLILAGPSALINRCILAAPLMVAIGLISYPLYLWHWPIMAFLRNADRDLTPTSGIVAIALSFLMAILTFVLLEKPLRQLRGTARRNATLVLLIVSLLVIGGGTLLVVKKGFPGHIDGAVVQRSAVFDLKSSPQAACQQRYRFDGDLCRSRHIDTNPDAVIIGDSHADHTYLALSESMDQSGKTLLLLGNNGCPPLPGVRFQKLECQKYTDAAFEIAARSPAKTVVLAGRGPIYMLGKAFGEVEKAKDKQYGAILVSNPRLSHQEAYMASLESAFQLLTHASKHIVFVLDNPELGFHTRDCIDTRPMHFFNASGVKSSDCSIPRTIFDQRNELYRQRVMELAKRYPNVQLVDAAEPFCDESACRGILNGTLMYRDETHLTPAGSKLVSEKIMAILKSS